MKTYIKMYNSLIGFMLLFLLILRKKQDFTAAGLKPKLTLDTSWMHFYTNI